MSVHVDTRQLRELATDFRFAALTARVDAQDAIERGGYQIQALAQIGAPVDTGALRNSISTDFGSLSATVGPMVDYGGYVELGTSRMAPQPYLAPAFDRALPRILDDLADGAVLR